MKTGDCLNNEHGACPGFTKETKPDMSTTTLMCACPCHDPMYHLVRNSLAVVNQSSRNNPYQFTSGTKDD